MNKILRFIFGVIVIAGTCINFVFENEDFNSYVSVAVLISLAVECVLYVFS